MASEDATSALNQNRSATPHADVGELARAQSRGLVRRRFSRDAYRRRLLLLADAVSAALVCAGLSAGLGGHDQALWALLFLPAWLVLAKLLGLYDRDHRALRYLTVDDIPLIGV